MAGTTHSKSIRTISPVPFISQVLTSLIPSFLRRKTTSAPTPAHASSSNNQSRSKSTALDGLRGLAAFIVMNGHYFSTFYEINDGRYKHYLHIPFISFFVSAHAMVSIFFVISGYVLSIKTLRLAKQRQWASLNHCLASSVFRRGLRLFLPCMVALWLSAFALKLGFYERTRHFTWQLPPKPETWTGALALWASSVRVLMYAFRWDLPMVPLSHPLWTIGAEFRGSMVVFLMLMAVVRIRSDWVVLLCLVGTMVWAGSADRWELVAFLAGTAVALGNMMVDAWGDCTRGDCEVGLPAQDEVMPFLETEKPAADRHRNLGALSRNCLWVVFLAMSLYLLTYPPTMAWETPGYRTLGRLSVRFYSQEMRGPQGIGAILIVFAATNNSLISQILNLPPIQYLGNISYSLYIVHDPLLKLVVYRVVENIWLYIGPEAAAKGAVGYVGAIVVGYGLLLVCVFCTADVFWRAVDAKSVVWSRKVEKWVFMSE
ncbi:hypothetical protein EJ08DRAFT_581201 [Tothia fuscella]|uniref:Acyltransferase 3 domain-containing protein n=1 Tax=Tothia fuscella TaxID=1048955 RepID=A0A9P4P055_9PEZI|nr:hypothetical protein EJ08DRAFT_581201 [Tothia fuscella]